MTRGEAVKDYYQVLDIRPDASTEDIKRAFRQQIALYHPDKVQHLAREFQDLAGLRAAELTEAYATLSDPVRRAEYDQLLANPPEDESDAAPAEPPQAGAPQADSPEHQPPPSDEWDACATPVAEAEAAPGEAGGPAAAVQAEAPPGPEPRRARRSERSSTFAQERGSRDELLRRASVARLRDAVRDELGECDAPSAGFDVFCAGKAPGLLGLVKGRPLVLGRFVPQIDSDALRTAGEAAARLKSDAAVRCVFLLGAIALRAGDLDTIASLRRRSFGRQASDLVLVPVDVRTWKAYVPAGAPPVARAVVRRLQQK